MVSAPDAFAEAALFLEGSYPAYAETLSDSQLLFFPKRDFIQLIERNPRLSINMIISLSQYLKKFTALVEELSLKEVSARIAKYLIDLSLKLAKEGKSLKEVELDLSKTQLARIRASIEQFGICQPVLVSASNEIVQGHGIVEAARSIGLKELPAIVVDHLSPNELRLL